MKNLKNINELKLASKSSCTRPERNIRQWKSNITRNIKMRINGKIQLLGIIPAKQWKFIRIENDSKYLSIVNYKKQEEDILEKKK